MRLWFWLSAEARALLEICAALRNIHCAGNSRHVRNRRRAQNNRYAERAAAWLSLL